MRGARRRPGTQPGDFDVLVPASVPGHDRGMDETIEERLTAVRTWLAGYFPHGRLERQTVDGPAYGLVVVTPTRRYRLFLDAELVVAESGEALVARCHADAVQWRLADAGEMLVTAAGAARPPPDFPRD